MHGFCGRCWRWWGSMTACSAMAAGGSADISLQVFLATVVPPLPPLPRGCQAHPSLPLPLSLSDGLTQTQSCLRAARPALQERVG